MHTHAHTFRIWNKIILVLKKKNLNFSLCLRQGGVPETRRGGVEKVWVRYHCDNLWPAFQWRTGLVCVRIRV